LVLTFGLLLGLWLFPIVEILARSHRSVHVGSADGVGPASAGMSRHV